MFDRDKLYTCLLLVLSYFLINSLFYHDPEVNIATLLALLILGPLAYSCKKSEISIKYGRDIFASHYNRNIFYANLKEDKALREAIEYVWNLTPEDFVTFSRVLVEIRDSSNQEALKEVSRYFRRKK